MPVRSCLGIRKKNTKSKNCMKNFEEKTALVFFVCWLSEPVLVFMYLYVCWTNCNQEC